MMASSSWVVSGAFLCLVAFGYCQGATWSYSDVNSWNTLHEPHCGGQSQSPIDLKSSEVTYDPTLASFTFNGFDTTTGITWKLKNTGYTAQVDFGGNVVRMSGGSLPSTEYEVAQFHFHWGSINSQGSEHKVDGAFYPMELHIVTFNTQYANLSASLSHSDGVAVLGFFLEVTNSDNPNLASIVTGLASVTTASTQTDINSLVALSTLMGNTTNYYRYSGSLTTPVCYEVVTWTVFEDTIPISNTQLNAFRALRDSSNNTIQDNYRPVQPLNSRSVKSSFQVSAASSVSSATGLLPCLAAAILLSLGFRH